MNQNPHHFMQVSGSVLFGDQGRCIRSLWLTTQSSNSSLERANSRAMPTSATPTGGDVTAHFFHFQLCKISIFFGPTRRKRGLKTKKNEWRVRRYRVGNRADGIRISFYPNTIAYMTNFIFWEKPVRGCLILLGGGVVTVPLTLGG